MWLLIRGTLRLRRASATQRDKVRISFYEESFKFLEQTEIKRAPLTFGRLSLWRSIQGLTPKAYSLSQIWKLPAGSTLTSVEGAYPAPTFVQDRLRFDGVGGEYEI